MDGFQGLKPFPFPFPTALIPTRSKNHLGDSERKVAVGEDAIAIAIAIGGRSGFRRLTRRRVGIGTENRYGNWEAARRWG